MFFRLKDEGSWLDIGTSISHYVICSALSVIVLLGNVIADFVMNAGKIDNHYCKDKIDEQRSAIRNLL